MQTSRTARERALERLREDNDAESHRPALERLALDVREIREELMDGFEDRGAVLWWCQRLAVRTLGEVPQRVYHGIARQFRIDQKGNQPVLLAAFLTNEQRERELEKDVATDLRTRFQAQFVAPAFNRAFGRLREDVGEYFDDDGADLSGHSAGSQRYVAMRPSLDEIERHQHRALARLLVGFTNREDLLGWSEDVTLATHGEIDSTFINRCLSEGSTRTVLLGDDPENRSARELFAAHHLLPEFNAGVRDLAGRSGERPKAEHEKTGGTRL